MRRNARLGAMVAGTGALALIACLAGPAQAAVAPATTTSALSALLYCDPPSGPLFDCSVAISGGTAPYTSTWSGNANVHYTSTGTTYAQGYCSYSAKWTVTVRDSAGATVSSSQYGYCNPFA